MSYFGFYLVVGGMICHRLALRRYQAAELACGVGLPCRAVHSRAFLLWREGQQETGQAELRGETERETWSRGSRKGHGVSEVVFGVFVSEVGSRV